MKVLSIVVSLVAAGVSVSAHSELLRGSGHTPRRLKQAGGAPCDVARDCHDNGSCDGGNPATTNVLDGTCDCDFGWEGKSCDSKIEFDLNILAFRSENLRSVEVCKKACKGVVDDVSDRKDKDIKENFGGTRLVDCDMDKFDPSASPESELERLMLETGGPGLRRLGSGSVRRLGGDDNQEVVGLQLPFDDTRTTGATEDCLSAADEARRKLEKKLSLGEAKDLNGKTFELRTGECNERDIASILEKAASYSSSHSHSRE